MSERIHQSQEQEHNSKELHQAANEQRERITEQLERRAEQSHETDVEIAKQEALESAKKAEKLDETAHNKLETTEKSPISRKRTKKNLDISFKKQMSDAQHDMSGPSRAFSKLIHNKAIEKTSEAIGSTVARPNAILAGSMCAFFIVLGVYLLARYVGYPLSGFEVIGSFIIGWLIGIIFDFMRVMITGKR